VGRDFIYARASISKNNGAIKNGDGCSVQGAYWISKLTSGGRHFWIFVRRVAGPSIYNGGAGEE
jgi:hypothetical protein